MEHLGGPASHCTRESLFLQLGPDTPKGGLKKSAPAIGECLLVQHAVRGRSTTIPGVGKEVRDWMAYVRCENDSTATVLSSKRSELYTILALSAFELSVNTHHFWRCVTSSPALPPAQSASMLPSAVVHCSFGTNFKGPILIATDVSLYLFLRNLAEGYKQRASRKFHRIRTFRKSFGFWMNFRLFGVC